MRIKESSDELNPPVTTTGTLPLARTVEKRTARDWLALAVATCGVGYLPLAPGTYGSAVGVGLYLVVNALGVRLIVYGLAHGWSADALASLRLSSLLLIVLALTLAGIRAASRAEGLLGRKDPGAVVVDEVAGQFMTFLFVPPDAGWWAILVGFLAFRAFDIWKPYPIRRLEALESGLGIMADDLLAGAYACVLMSLLITVQFWL
ncbi:MAG TPA: phosphatidylglycerophosphatase A [Pyrinomonadaceae bacterium]|nr:phosphatidylglycerophosphatase A [Pyrinomonadaceae bacterium]